MWQAAQPRLDAPFPWRDPASNTALWQVGQRAVPKTPFHPSSTFVWHLLEQRTGHDRDRNFGAETKNLGWEALPAGLPAQPAAGKSLNQTHM